MSKTHKIIVFHIGHLGDTLMIIPALKTLKKITLQHLLPFLQIKSSEPIML